MINVHCISWKVFLGLFSKIAIAIAILKYLPIANSYCYLELFYWTDFPGLKLYEQRKNQIWLIRLVKQLL